MKILAVAFDAYGTLCSIGERTDPYRPVVREATLEPSAARRCCLTRNSPPAELIASLCPAGALDVDAIEREIRREVASVRLFPDVEETLARLRERDLRIAVVSNLAAPYADPVRRLLHGLVDELVWSFEVGAVKPEGAIFEEVCRRLALPPSQVLMVGDSLRADIEGAHRHGMPAVLLDREDRGGIPLRITTLLELPGGIVESCG